MSSSDDDSRIDRGSFLLASGVCAGCGLLGLTIPLPGSRPRGQLGESENSDLVLREARHYKKLPDLEIEDGYLAFTGSLTLCWLFCLSV